MSEKFTIKHEDWPACLNLDEKADMKEPLDADIKGSFPKWIKGSLYRNGPGVFKMGETEFRHLFEGFCVLTRWTIIDGKVTYRSSIMDSETYKKAFKANRITGIGFGVYHPDPCKSIFEKFFSYFKPPESKDNPAINIVEFGDQMYALTEPTKFHRVDGDTLHSDEKLDMKNNIAVHMGTAHPHFDPEGNMYYYATSFANRKEVYKFVKFPNPKKISPPASDPFSKGEVIVALPSRWKINHGYTHAFGMTDKYIIHFEHPLCFNLLSSLTASFWGTPFEETILAYPDEGINIMVADRHTGKQHPVTYLAPHGFVFHFINCYEEDDQLVVDVCLWEDCTVMKQLYIDAIMRLTKDKKSHPARFARYVLPLNVEGAKPGENLVKLPGSKATAVLRPGTNQVLDVTCDHVFPLDKCFELPRINYDYNGKKYRYSYATTLWNPNPAIYKFDAETAQVMEWKCTSLEEDATIPIEPVFIADPQGTKEDDGVVLCPVVAKKTGVSPYLVCLDASSMKELGRAVLPSDVKVNVSFHGDFYNRLG